MYQKHSNGKTWSSKLDHILNTNSFCLFLSPSPQSSGSWRLIMIVISTQGFGNGKLERGTHYVTTCTVWNFRSQSWVLSCHQINSNEGIKRTDKNSVPFSSSHGRKFGFLGSVPNSWELLFLLLCHVQVPVSRAHLNNFCTIVNVETLISEEHTTSFRTSHSEWKSSSHFQQRYIKRQLNKHCQLHCWLHGCMFKCKRHGE